MIFRDYWLLMSACQTLLRFKFEKKYVSVKDKRMQTTVLRVLTSNADVIEPVITVISINEYESHFHTNIEFLSFLF